jgi:hypothetical protein
MLYGRWSGQHVSTNIISCNPRNNDIGWIAGHIALIWNEVCSAWKLWNQARHGKKVELQRQIRLDQVKRQRRFLYYLQPLCNLTNHCKWFYMTPAEHFLHEPALTKLPNWVTAYEPMIRARIKQQLNQQGLTVIDKAFEHTNSLGP